MNNIEVEIRSFISEEKYQQLLDFFKMNARLLKEDDQETFYFSGKHDLRIQRNNSYAKIWTKKGKLHDDHREELEIKFDRSDFERLESLFLALGFEVEIKWFRKRCEFEWDDITVCLDHTRGYGYIIELEKMSSEEEKGIVYEKLQAKLASLDIAQTPKEEFDRKFIDYKQNWKSLVGDDNAH